MISPSARAITRELAAYAAHSRFDALPGRVRLEAHRTFLNWMGCALGGSHEPSVEMAVAAAAEGGSAPQASIIGHPMRTDVAGAAFVNCMSSSALAFDDTHLATVTHPTGPVAAALFALCETRKVAGDEFVNALALGIEVECRLSNVLLLPPAKANLGLYVTGITGPIGAAAAVGRLLKLDEDRMRWAIGLAAAQAAGFRATHSSMAAWFVPAHAARSGLFAATLAAKGFTCSDNTLEAPNGFVAMFSSGAALDRGVEGLGERFELLANAYKPYPCGIVIHPLIDACLEIASQLQPGDIPASVALRVHPLTLTLTDRPKPATPLEAQISLHHWAAACIVQGEAGLAQQTQACIDDPGVVSLRARVSAVADPALQRDEAVADVTLECGRVLSAHAAHARGSIDRPMTDGELNAKFRSQARMALADAACERLLGLCRNVSALADVGKEIAAAWTT
jgi:2-methylcitrate dehydratase PrpD